MQIFILKIVRLRNCPRLLYKTKREKRKNHLVERVTQMGAFRDNDINRNADSNNQRPGNADSINAAPELNSADNSVNKGGKGFVYPGSSDFDTQGGGSDDFEYGDASVAGEYEVKESAVFSFGDGSVPETIGAYYGNETRQDRYAKGSFIEGYGYETVPEVDYSQVENEQITAEFVPEQPVQEPQNQNVQYENMPEYNTAPQGYDHETDDSDYYGYHESQADELDSVRSASTDDEEPYKYDTDEDPNIAGFGMPFIDDQDEENMSSLPANRIPSGKLTLSIAVGAIAIAGIIGIFCFAFFCDRRKTNENTGTEYEVPTTKEEITTAAETTPEATATPTPVPTDTPTPEPTATPVPTNTSTPKPQTPVYWPVAKKATPTPTTAPVDETTGEGTGGEGTGGEGTGGEGTGGEGTGGEGTGGEGTGGEGTGGEGTGGEGTGGQGTGGEGTGGEGTGGSGSGGGSTSTPPANEPEPQAENNP